LRAIALTVHNYYSLAVYDNLYVPCFLGNLHNITSATIRRRPVFMLDEQCVQPFILFQTEGDLDRNELNNEIFAWQL
jgi:hypothetical protein